ncbi:MAG: hypothetical protein AB2777_22720, partial [Candidatus Thiodiazotropha endolucinida]
MTDIHQNAISGLLGRFFSTLFTDSKQASDEHPIEENGQEAINPETDDPYLSGAVPEIEVLQGVREELRRLKRMRNDELNKAEQLIKQLKDIEKERISILTQSKIEDDKELLKSADALLKKIGRLERERKDCVG